MPANIAALLYVVCTLLEYGRHLAATIERRAAMPGFSLFVAIFGTTRLPVIIAHLHRAILRAAALETLLLKRAATGRDVTITPPRIRTATGGNAHPTNDPTGPQIDHLTSERARHDAPLDPDHLPTPEEIEAEVSRRPFGRTIAGICRDFGVVPGLCTREFWDAAIEAIACHDGSVATYWQDMQRKSEQFQQALEDDPELQQMDRDASLYLDQTPGACPETIESNFAASPNRRLQRCYPGCAIVSGQALGFKLGEPPIDPFRDTAMPPAPHANALQPDMHPAAAGATGPPLLAALKLAA